MFCKNAAIITLTTMLIAPTAYAGLLDNSNTQTKPNQNLTKTQANDPKSNGNILTSVQNMIEKKFNQHNVNVKVHQGTVVLRGYVDNDQMKQNIEGEVRKIQGVKNVTNLLNIKGLLI